MSRLTRLIDTIVEHSENIGEVIYELCRIGIPMAFGFAAFGCVMCFCMSLMLLALVRDFATLLSMLFRIVISVYGFFVLRNVAYRFLEESGGKGDNESY